jgi:hypothetical protein
MLQGGFFMPHPQPPERIGTGSLQQRGAFNILQIKSPGKNNQGSYNLTILFNQRIHHSNTLLSLRKNDFAGY